jgi:hypothetical protein
MKLKAGIFAVCLLALACVFAAAPAFADSVVYNNTGPATYTTNAWSIFNYGGGEYTVTDSFTLSISEIVDGADFYIWLYPGDLLTSVTWGLSFTPYGTPFETGTAVGGPNTQVATAFGYYPVLEESISIPAVSMASGTYWLQLSNGLDAYDDAVWWDQSSGPSTAYETGGVGAIPSETFQILADPTPEPPSFLLFGAGMLALAGLLATRSKLLA